MNNRFSIDYHLIWKSMLNTWKQTVPSIKGIRLVSSVMCMKNSTGILKRNSTNNNGIININAAAIREHPSGALPHRNIKMFQSLRFLIKKNQRKPWWIWCTWGSCRGVFSRLLKDPDGKKWIEIDVLYIFSYFLGLNHCKNQCLPSVQLCYKPSH